MDEMPELPAGDAPATKEVDCPHCGAVQTHDDDFCYDCGHSFEWRSADSGDLDDEAAVTTCSMCDYGEIVLQSDGVRQCDRCGFTVRDWPEA